MGVIFANSWLIYGGDFSQKPRHMRLFLTEKRTWRKYFQERLIVPQASDDAYVSIDTRAIWTRTRKFGSSTNSLDSEKYFCHVQFFDRKIRT